MSTGVTTVKNVNAISSNEDVSNQKNDPISSSTASQSKHDGMYNIFIYFKYKDFNK